MFGERLPRECRGCGEDVVGLDDHADGCDVAERIAERQLEEVEERLGSSWETERDRKRVEYLRGLLDGGDEA